MPIDYKKGKIYKIVNNENNKIYYGSTTQPLHKRMFQHRSKNNKCTTKNLGVDLKDCQIILVEKFACDCKYELLKRERYYIENNDCVNSNIPTRTKKEYQQKNKQKINEYAKQYNLKNKQKIAEKAKEYNLKNYEKNKEKIKEKYEKNKQLILKQKKQYNLKNKEKINQNAKQYYEKKKKIIIEKAKEKYEKNKQLILKQKKEYYEKNKQKAKQYYQKNKQKIKEKKAERDKDKAKEKITCECGSVFNKVEKSRHYKSKKHQKFICNPC